MSRKFFQTFEIITKLWCLRTPRWLQYDTLKCHRLQHIFHSTHLGRFLSRLIILVSYLIIYDAGYGIGRGLPNAHFFIIHQEWLHMYRFHAIKSLNRQENSSINFNLFNKFRTSNILLSIHCHLADNIMNIHVYMIHTVCFQKTNVFLNIV